MIDLEFIERLMRAFDASGIDSLEIERGGTRVKLAKTPPSVSIPAFPPSFAAVPPAQPSSSAPSGSAEEARASEKAPPAPHSDLLEITSPMVGTFYRAPAPDAPPYVEPGRRVVPGDTLCIIEAMKLMNELECEVTGTIVEVCLDNAQPVEYGQVLFRVDPR
ncbi:MAG TPA: acetyl-CoA carboxylase biotin carboxyl carrier protein [Longimicrobiales bacterium]|nr:acetyl-CoA carboxylase biotin carboxyl carrier protein [Longimicrobiales bacterium]